MNEWEQIIEELRKQELYNNHYNVSIYYMELNINEINDFRVNA